MTPPGSAVHPSLKNAPSGLRPRTVGNGFLFGVPVGDLGWFATLLVSVATGFATFFAATFLGIMGLLIANAGFHHTYDYSLSYRAIGLPAGLFILVVTLIYLGFLWVRRILRRA